MNYTPQQLSEILQRDGYGIADGSIFDLSPTMPVSAKAPQRPSTAPSWPSERHFQAAVIAECDRRAVLEPEYGLVCHIPNENSHRQPGVRAGMPDLFLPCARGGHIGLWLELKCGSNKPTPAQLGMIYKLRMERYRCHIVWDSLDEAMGIIEDYLRGDA